MKDKFLIRVAVWLVLRKEDQILLLRRHNTGYKDGNYTLISGHLEKDEGITEALVREAKEESGIEVLKEDVSVAHVSHRKCEDGLEYMYFFCTADKWKGEPKNTEPNKCDDMQWFNIENLPKNTLEQVVQAINEIEEGNTYSEIGW